MRYDTPKYVMEIARKLRKEQTGAEVLLWEILRDRKLQGYKFRRQYPLGRFVADFYCDQAKLVIELDGIVHDYTDVIEYDKIRQATIESRGIQVLRIRNEDVFRDLEGVLRKIVGVLEK